MSHEVWWQRMTTKARQGDEDSLSWEQSSNELRAATHFSLEYVQQPEANLISIGELPRSLAALKNVKPLEGALQGLARLELNGHALLTPVASSYRQALQAWLKGDLESYARILDRAETQLEYITALHGRANDYLDWFLVNNAMDVDHTDYRDYARRVEQLEAIKVGLGKAGL
ncbi:MAG: hypothetical protein HC904_13860 [Blastochloris sp.]|nr:hypothetical protein [Blastochloris sp.]